MGRFDFGGLPLDGALRLTFAALHVPGEAQKVDRVLQVMHMCTCTACTCCCA